MKPPKYKNKVSFGEFKCQAQAGRVGDVAFHYYGKPHLLHFSDTPHILSTRPTPAAGLGEEDKLRFVKEQAKWMASMASSLPGSSPPTSVPFQIPESSGLQTLEFRSFSEIASFLSCGDDDEANDDAISQPQPSCDAIIGTSESEREDMSQWNYLEDALIVDRCLLSAGWSPSSSSVQITWTDGMNVQKINCCARPTA